MSNAPIDSQKLIRDRLKELRGGKRQDQFAAELRRDCGLPWTQATIADIERRNRRISFEELLALSQRYSLAQLLQSDGPVKLLGHVVSAGTWNAALPKKRPSLVWGDEKSFTDPVSVAAASLQAEQRLARKLSRELLRPVSARDVANAAIRKWGMTLTDKREHELHSAHPAAAKDSSTNRLVRSHITRKLEEDILQELRAERIRNRAANQRLRKHMEEEK